MPLVTRSNTRNLKLSTVKQENMGTIHRRACVLFMALLIHTVRGERTIGSVPALERRMFTALDSIPCVRLLNTTGGIGCSNPDRDLVEVALQRVTSTAGNLRLGGPRAIVLPYGLLDAYLARLEIDDHLRRRTKGIIVEWGAAPPQGASHDHAAPAKEWATYVDTDYAWNPQGSGTNWQKYDFPIFLLSSTNSTEDVIKRANSNEERDFKHPLYSAQFRLPMTPVYLGTHDSGSCLGASTCQPLAGYSVWAALPPLPPLAVNATDNSSSPSSSSSSSSLSSSDFSAPSREMRTILVIAQLDGSSFFHDLVVSAESSMSGLVAMLATAQALARLNDTSKWSHRVVFLALAADTWGLTGTHRFLSELYAEGESVAGIRKDSIDMVIEIGSVGRSVRADNQTMHFFVHRDHRQRTSGAVDSILAAFIAAATGKNAQASGGLAAVTGEDVGSVRTVVVPEVKVSLANASNPGLPPSSLRGFLYVNGSLPGVVFADFDRSYANKYADSAYDNADNINPVSVTGAASLLARALLRLAKSPPTPPPFPPTPMGPRLPRPPPPSGLTMSPTRPSLTPSWAALSGPSPAWAALSSSATRLMTRAASPTTTYRSATARSTRADPRPTGTNSPWERPRGSRGASWRPSRVTRRGGL
eukprot:jgi/Mesvir1/7942/Mv11862-RA.1